MRFIPYRIVLTLVYSKIQSARGDLLDLDRAAGDRSRVGCEGDRVSRGRDGNGCSKSVGCAGQDQHQSENGQVADFTIASELISFRNITKMNFINFNYIIRRLSQGLQNANNIYLLCNPAGALQGKFHSETQSEQVK
jgi:hypothetical protein